MRIKRKSTVPPDWKGLLRAWREVEAAIKQYLSDTSGAPKPFVWIKTADEILASVARIVRELQRQGTSVQQITQKSFHNESSSLATP